mgnify:CR=1 FL=1
MRFLNRRFAPHIEMTKNHELRTTNHFRIFKSQQKAMKNQNAIGVGLALGAGLGVAIGAAVGAMIDDVAMGVALGIALGAGLGLAIGAVYGQMGGRDDR